MGELMRLMEREFDVFITADQNLPFQWSLRNTRIPVIILGARTNRYEDLKKLVPQILKYFHDTHLKGIKRIFLEKS